MFLVGAVLVVGLTVLAAKLVTKYWDDICYWLNNTAADVVQKYIGYDARKAMHKAVNKADRFMNKIRNVSKVYYRKDPFATYYDVVTMQNTAPTYEFDEEFIKTIDEKKALTHEMEYTIDM